MLRKVKIGFFAALALVASSETVQETFTESAALKYLPNGTALVNVIIPSFDQERRVTSVLEASEIQLVEKNEGLMQGSDVILKLMDEAGKVSFETEMDKCLYNYKNGFLDSQDKTVLMSETMYLKGDSARYDLKGKRFFLAGPAVCRVMSRAVSANLFTSLISSLALLPSTAAPPNAPSSDLLIELESHRNNATESVSDSSFKLQHDERVTELSSTIDTGLNDFFEQAGGTPVLVNEQEEQRAKLQAPDGALELQCEGGIYYDYENGYIVCLKNVYVKDPRFTMRCDKELKIILEPQKDQNNQEEGDMLAGMSSGQVSEMIASGNVKITYHQVKGEPVKATGATAHFDAKTEELLIDGGLPTFRQGTHFFEALEPSVWVKLSRKGFTTGPGKKRTVYLPKSDDE